MNKEEILKEVFKLLDEKSSELSGEDYLSLMEDVKEHCADSITAYNDTHSED